MKKKILKFTLLTIMILGTVATLNAGDKKHKKHFPVTTTSSKSYIGTNRAIAIALKKVPGARNSNVKEIHLDRENGRMVYEGEIHYNGWEYEFDIDAVTGAVVRWEVDKD